MKAAEEWIAEAIAGNYVGDTEEQCVRMIQADALKHAAKRLRTNTGVELTPQSIRLKWAKEFEREAKELEAQ